MSTPDNIDDFNRANADLMGQRLRHGAQKFGPPDLTWREQPYTDEHNIRRLDIALMDLRIAQRHFRAGIVDAGEVRKRAADVANQAFIFADPDRLHEDARPSR